METFHQVRNELNARRRALHRRVRALDLGVETSPDSRWRVVGNGHPPRSLASFVADSLVELGQIEASLRRIAQHTFDVCILCGSTISVDLLRRNPLAATCRACSRGFDLDYFKQIRTQHTDLGRFIAVVRGGIEGLEETLQSEEACSEEAAIVCAALGILRRELSEHFELEERNGYLGDALRASPHLTGRARHLREDHQLFVEEMNAIVAIAERGSGGAGSWKRIRGRFERVAEAIALHERAENAVIASAFLEDGD